MILAFGGFGYKLGSVVTSDELQKKHKEDLQVKNERIIDLKTSFSELKEHYTIRVIQLTEENERLKSKVMKYEGKE